MLQEEELDVSKRCYFGRVEHKDHSKCNLKQDKAKLYSKADDSKKSDDTKKAETPGIAEKVANLKAYRRAKGLCFTCGEKWSKTHKCPASVSLNVIEELMEVLQLQGDSPSDIQSDDSGDSDELMVISRTPVQLTKLKRRILKLKGSIGKQDILILVDFGNVASFVSSDLVQQLQYQVVATPATTFTVADGG
uniref:Uncharacterized protein n=1 Tax=Arundo donax TaxID=35708 RepID=A0A0A9DXJ4_ARUDO